MTKKIIKILGLLSIFISIIIVTLITYFYQTSYNPERSLFEQIQNNSMLSITENSDYYSLKPQILRPNKDSIIYYTGGLVKPESYLYKMGQVAIRKQVNIYVIKPFANLAILNINQANKVFENEKINKAQIGGHSLGGVVACRFTKNNPTRISKLFLFGSYCDQDISNLNNLQTVSIVGKNDKITKPESYNKAKINLPSNTTFLEPEGLNHSDFGNYGLQKDDQKSDLSNDEIIKILDQVL